jgi:hypothetical protein
MKSNFDTKYIDALNNYSKSLEEIVLLLQQQVDNKDTDIVESLTKNMSENIGKIIEDLDEIRNTTKDIQSNTNKILQEIKDIKNQKESGLFGQVSDPSNKNKIVDGIKIITLIAGGVLAIGLAFKLIGDVDILSVITLGISITLLAVTFTYINEKLKNQSIGRTLALTGMVLIMSLSVMLASKILIQTAPLSLNTMLAVTFTALTMGGALYLLSQSFDKIKFNFKTLIGFLLLPILTPIVAMSIVTSSHIFKNAATIGFNTILSVAFTSVALGVALYAISTAISKMNTSASVMSMLTKGAVFGVIIAAVAGGIVSGSMLLSKVTPISLMQGLTAIFTAVTLGIILYAVSKVIEFTDGISIMKAIAVGALMLVAAWSIKKASDILSGVIPFSFSFAIGLVVTSIAIGIALIAFSFAWKLFSQNLISYTGAGGSSPLKTAYTILVAAMTVALVSQILTLGNYSGIYPNWEWSLQVGMSLVIFGGAMITIHKYFGDEFKDIKKIGMSLLTIVGIATTIMLTSWILSVGKYDKKPDIDWVKNVGISLVTFGGVVLAFGYIMGFSGGTGYLALLLGLVAIVGIAVAIVATSYILSVGDYSLYPNSKWLTGVGAAVGAFSLLGPLAVLGVVFAIPILAVAGTIALVSKIISLGNYTKGPSLEWATGTGLLMTAFSVSAIALGLIAMTGIGALAIIAGVAMMRYVAKSIVDISKILAGGTYVGGPTFEWANGVGTAITAFASAISTMGLATGGIMSLFVGIDVNKMKQAISTIVDGMVEANRKLSDPSLNWSSNYPSKEWADGVGTAVSKFAEASRSLRGNILQSDMTKSFIPVVGVLMDGIIASAKKMQGTYDINWNSLPYPNSEWVTNVGNALQSFIDLSRALRGNLLEKNIINTFVSTVDTLITGLIHIGTKFSIGVGGLIKWSSLSYPKKEWVENINNAITSFIILSRKEYKLNDITNINRLIDTIISIANRLNNNNFNSNAINKFAIDLKTLTDNVPTKDVVDRLALLSDSIIKISNIGLSTSASIYMLSKSLKNLGETITEIDMNTFDKLTKFSSSFTALSLIDNLKLQETINIIKAKRLDIKAVLDDNSASRYSINTPNSVGNYTINSPFLDTNKIANPLNDLVEYNKNIDKNIQEMLNIQRNINTEDATSPYASKPTNFSRQTF